MSFLYDSHSSHLEFHNIVHMLPFLQDISALLVLFLHYWEKWDKKKAEEMKLHSNCQVGLTSHCRRENKEESPFPFTLQTPRDRVSLWAQGQTPHCAASNPVAGQAPEEMYLNCLIPSPAAEAQQLQCSDTQAVLRDVAHLKSGQDQATLPSKD